MTNDRARRQMPPRLRALLLACACAALAACAVTAPGGARTEAAIRAVLARQLGAWNSGDIDGFMQAYLQADELRIASGSRVLSGHARSLAAYRAAFADAGSMGRLEYADVVVESLGDGYALAFGRWRLANAEGDREGLFSLLMARTIDGWKIARDHTSTGRSRIPATPRSPDSASGDSASRQ